MKSVSNRFCGDQQKFQENIDFYIFLKIDKTKENVLQVQYIQPWSNMICKFKLPDHVFERLWELYDYTMGIKWKSFGGQLVGQINEEPEVTPDILEKFPEWGQWCIQSVEQFIQTQMSQSVIGSESPDDFFKQKLLF